MTRAQIAALVARVEAGETGRELDRAVYASQGFCLHPNTIRSGAQSDTGFDCVDCGANSWGRVGPKGERLRANIPAYTTSIDAQAALPGRVIAIQHLRRHELLGQKHAWRAWAESDQEPCPLLGREEHEACAPTRAGAELAALLRAMMETCDE